MVAMSAQTKGGRVRGVFALLCATLFWGTSVVVARVVLRETTPQVVSLVGAVACMITLLLPLALFRSDLLRIERRDWWRFALLGAFGFSLGSLFINVAIQRTNAATAATLQYLCPAITYAWGLARRSERFDWWKVLAVGLSIVGCALTTGALTGSFLFDPWGVLAGVASATTFAFITIFGKTFAPRYNPLAYSGYVFLPMSVALACITPLRDLVALTQSPKLFALLLANSVFFGAVPTVLYFESLKWISATAVTIVLSFEIVVVSALGWLYLGEHLSIAQMVGAVMVISAVILIERSTEEPDAGSSHEPVATA